MPVAHAEFVHERVRRQAELDPCRIALVDEEGQSVTYGALSARAAAIAGRLGAAGVRPEDPVAVCLGRSAELIACMLGTLQAGGAYVPVDPTYPPARIAAMLANLRPAAAIARGAPPAGLPPDVPVLAPDGEGADGAAAAPRPLSAGNLAYVLYTSGSTGAPKGVAMTHGGLSRLIDWQVEDGEPGLATLNFTPAGFDVTFQEVFSTLCTGGTLFLVPEAVRRDPERLLEALARLAIERIFLPYVALQQLAAAAQRLGIVPSALRHVVTAGERLIVTPAIAHFFRALPHCRLDNHYGPTEAHLVTRHTLSGDAGAWPVLPPVGTAVGGVWTYNLDPSAAPVAPGKTGELYVGGAGVARGYQRAPALTAERFVPDPWRAGERMYRTGDVVRVDAAGVVEFVGRADDQIKVRGYRVECAEVELALTSHPGVRAAAVALRPLAGEVEGLAAYVVCQGTPPSAADLTQYVRAVLPPYMVPAVILFLPALPLTATGKVDHGALRALVLPGAADDGADATEGASLSDVVRSIWERVLGHDEIATDDDFFDVGGDSLLAAWVAAELAQVLGREVDLSLLLRDSTIEGLARALEEEAPVLPAGGAVRLSEVVTLRPGPSSRHLFLVHPLGGELLAYRALARAIRSPLRVVGLQWRAPAVAGEGPRSLEQMAAAHVAQMRSVQSSGPYLVAGWSFGGVLAFEIAQQLVAAGERVDFLGLFDANPVRDPLTGLRTDESPHYDVLTRALEEIDQSVAAGNEGVDVQRLFSDASLGGLLGDSVPAGVTPTHLKKNLSVARDSMWAAMQYRAAPYSGAIDVFQAEASPPDVRDALAVEIRALGHGPVRIHAVPGDHTGILRQPLVASTADAVDRALASI